MTETVGAPGAGRGEMIAKIKLPCTAVDDIMTVSAAIMSRSALVMTFLPGDIVTQNIQLSHRGPIRRVVGKPNSCQTGAFDVTSHINTAVAILLHLFAGQHYPDTTIIVDKADARIF